MNVGYYDPVQRVVVIRTPDGSSRLGWLTEAGLLRRDPPVQTLAKFEK